MEIFNSNGTPKGIHIMSYTYNGKDMGERSVTAIIKSPEPINIEVGDYVCVNINNMLKSGGDTYKGSIDTERFYIYTESSIKKRSRVGSVSDAFETTLVFYPRQYELGMVQMRDFITSEATNGEGIIYTGFDKVTFYGGAKMLSRKIIACLNNACKNGTIPYDVNAQDGDYNGLWKAEVAPGIDEELNTALNQFNFMFSGSQVVDAIMKLSEEEFCNTTFFIRKRIIYVGYKRPYLCRVDNTKDVIDAPLKLTYGKTSHLGPNADHGGLFDITKSVGSTMPITRLYAYGSSRNLNRYYCSDRLRSGRYINRLMLPQFDNDGKTDYIDSKRGIEKFGIREGSKGFTDVYPSLRYMTYGDLRKIKYVVKIKCNGEDESSEPLEHTLANTTYGMARVQCYKVVPSAINPDVNTLVEAWPDEDLMICVHGYHSRINGKVVKVLLCGGDNAKARQAKKDAVVPTRNGVQIPGAAFCVHDYHMLDTYAEGEETHTQVDFDGWFRKPVDSWDKGIYPTTDEYEDANLHRIIYTDTFYLTDVYIMEKDENGEPLYEKQEHFSRDGYSAYCYARFNDTNKYADSTLVNEVVGVEPIVLTDTSLNVANGTYQRGFDVYIRDCGFHIDEQNDFGEMVHIVNSEPKVNFIDGFLAGCEYSIDAVKNDSQYSIISAYREDGSFNQDFLIGTKNNAGPEIPQAAFENGAMWRMRLIRDLKDGDEGITLPTKSLNAKIGDHIVLLDIYMPDIYVKAAEERLLREASRYLERVDNGEVSYSVTIDPVRFNQIPNYALQMREGLNVRICDDDLHIVSDVDEKTIFNNNAGNIATIKPEIAEDNVTSVKVINYIDDGTDEHYTKMHFFVHKSHKFIFEARKQIALYDGDKTVYVNIPGLEEIGESYDMTFSQDVIDSIIDKSILTSKDWLYYQLDFTTIPFRCDTNLEIGYEISERTYRPLFVGEILDVDSPDLIGFQADRYYEVEFGMDGGIEGFVGKFYIKSEQGHKMYVEITDIDFHVGKRNNMEVCVVRFYTPASLDDSGDFRFGYELEYGSQLPYYSIAVYNVIQRNIDSNGKPVNYADMFIESINVTVTENTRPDEERGIEIVQEPIREISATLRSRNVSSSWTSLVQAVDRVSVEQDIRKETLASIADSARANYTRLLSLKDSIFDPDGKCTDTFLQVMMLQIGADSMNYMLDKTKVSIDGREYKNMTVTVRTPFVFVSIGDDILRHYVYTSGGQGGVWNVTAITHPIQRAQNEVYYISVKASRNNNDAQWIIDRTQRKVDEDANYWYFNYGIMTIESDNVTIIETRGNAYMYGDNLICGTISDMAKKSWFDLNRGEFVLGSVDGTRTGDAAMKYVDGVLTISGIDKKIDEITNMLMNDTEFLPTNLYVNQEQNPYVGDVIDGVYYFNAEGLDRHDRPYGQVRIHPLEGYDKTGGVFKSTLRMKSDVQSGIQLDVDMIAKLSNGTERRIVASIDTDNQWDESYELSFDVPDNLTVTEFCFGINDVSYRDYSDMHTLHLELTTSLIVKSESINYLTRAIKDGSTTIAGGLIMSKAMILGEGQQQSGLSGMDDDIALWAGGTYKDALDVLSSIPVVIRKKGFGSKVGPFRITESGSLLISTSSGQIEISQQGIFVTAQGENNPCVRITTDDVSVPKSEGKSQLPGFATMGWESIYVRETEYKTSIPGVILGNNKYLDFGNTYINVECKNSAEKFNMALRVQWSEDANFTNPKDIRLINGTRERVGKNFIFRASEHCVPVPNGYVRLVMICSSLETQGILISYSNDCYIKESTNPQLIVGRNGLCAFTNDGNYTLIRTSGSESNPDTRVDDNEVVFAGLPKSPLADWPDGRLYYTDNGNPSGPKYLAIK